VGGVAESVADRPCRGMHAMADRMRGPAGAVTDGPGGGVYAVTDRARRLMDGVAGIGGDGFVSQNGSGQQAAAEQGDDTHAR